jgi:Protein of unknown function (DUF3048) N-terminal domain/Protein of unknown function (DUF3048) C-terminal domain
MHRSRLISLVALFGALVIALGSLSACGGGGGNPSSGAAKATANKKKEGPPVWPLTGVADPARDAEKRCGVTVKIDNTSASLPKYGVEQADVVYEEVVEGGLTRLAAIFHSQAPQKVGSVRSVRKTDQSIVTPIGGVFAYSGGAAYAIESINTAPVVQLDENHAGSAMFREHRQTAPEFTLYANVEQLYTKCGDQKPPPAVFSYRAAKTRAAGDPVTKLRVGFLAGLAAEWTWDKPSGTWTRYVFDSQETPTGAPLAPKNVVVMFVNYVGGDPNYYNIGAEAQLVGEGDLQVYTAGKVIKGRWKRPDRAQAAQLFDAAGKEIKLTPGQTWVELPEVGYAVDVTSPPTTATPASPAAP